MLTVQHIPGVSNLVADMESRTVRDRSDWKLNPAVFARINKMLWTSGSGSLCIKTNLPAATFPQLEARPSDGSNRCFSAELEPP